MSDTFANPDRARGESVRPNHLTGARINLPEHEDSGGTALHARRTSHALRIRHRQSLVREVHDVDALVAHGGADIAGDAFFLVGQDAEPTEKRA